MRRPPVLPPAPVDGARGGSGAGGGGVRVVSAAFFTGAGGMAPGDGARGDTAAQRGLRCGRGRRLRQSGNGGCCGQPTGQRCAMFSGHSCALARDRLNRFFFTFFFYILVDERSEMTHAKAVRFACALFTL